MPAAIHMVKPQRAKVFGEYTRLHLLPFLKKQINDCTTRVDAVWDTYEKEISIHQIVQHLGPQRCHALIFFHAFTGCDITSAMHGIGKKTAWNIWQAFPHFTTTFNAITDEPAQLHLNSPHMQHLERFTVLMYSKHC